jgi:hypothetical protein
LSAAAREARADRGSVGVDDAAGADDLTGDVGDRVARDREADTGGGRL